VKYVRVHCRGAASSHHPAIFGEMIHATLQDLQAEFLVNCLPVGSMLVEYNNLRI
jgi:hypothetical protein